jgi:hypothetical protein
VHRYITRIEEGQEPRINKKLPEHTRSPGPDQENERRKKKKENTRIEGGHDPEQLRTHLRVIGVRARHLKLKKKLKNTQIELWRAIALTKALRVCVSKAHMLDTNSAVV